MPLSLNGRFGGASNELEDEEVVYTVRHLDVLAGSRVRCGDVTREEATNLHDNIVHRFEVDNDNDGDIPHTNNTPTRHHNHHLPHPIVHLKSPESTTQLSINNRVCNSKYTWYSFLPKNLWEQFHRPINFYFLVVAFLQFIPAIAPVSPLSTVLPLSFAFMVTAVKEGLDDWRRHRQDDEDNNRPVTIICRCWWSTSSKASPTSFCPHIQKELKHHQPVDEEENIDDDEHPQHSPPVESGGGGSLGLDALLVTVRRQDIVAGDYVLVEANEEVPCDMIALVSGKQQQPSSSPSPVSFDDTNDFSTSPTPPPPQSDSTKTSNTPPTLFQAFGSCYVSTENLDGESDSKPKTCLLSELLTTHVQQVQQLRSAAASGIVGGDNYDEDDDQLFLCCQFLHSSAAIRTATLVCDRPNRDFRQFEGRIELLHERVASSVESSLKCCPNHQQQSSPTTKVQPQLQHASPTPPTTLLLPCSIEHLLLSSSYLRPNESTFVIGLAVYVGGKTKVGCNSRIPATKWADLDKRTNNYTKRIFILQVVLTFMSTLIGYFVLKRAEERSWYLGYERIATPEDIAQQYSSPSSSTTSGSVFEPDGPPHHHHHPHHLGGARYDALFFFGILPMRYFLMFTVMVPISFKVLVEVSKFWVMQSIVWDASMTLATPLAPIPTSSSSSRRHRRRQLGLGQHNNLHSKSYDSIQSAVSTSSNTTTPTTSPRRLAHQQHDVAQYSYQGALVNNSTLAEDLGQVQVVLTDKTGTLTNNEMNIRYVCCVAAAVTQITTPLSPLTAAVSSPALAGTAYEAVLDVFEATPSAAKTAGLKKRGGHPGESNDAIGADDGQVVDYRGAIPLASLMSAPVVIAEEHIPTSSSGLLLHSDLVTRTNQHRTRMMEAMSLCNMISPNPTAPKTNCTTKTTKALSRQISEDQEAFKRSTIPINQLWSSPSPDELALMDGARQAGVYPTTRTRTHSKIVFPSISQSASTTTTSHSPTATSDYEYIARLDFTSERGLMSVLVRNHATNEILLLTKGSDERVLPLCTQVIGGCGDVENDSSSNSSPLSSSSPLGSSRTNQAPNNITTRHNKLLTSTAVSATAMLVNTKLKQYSREGLRTLVFAYRVVSQEEVDEWLAEHTAASSITTSSSPSSTIASSTRRSTRAATSSLAGRGQAVVPSSSVTSRESDGATSHTQPLTVLTREVAVRASEKRLERNLTLLGLTAVEDLLQIGVPRTIKSLRAANIKVWMLTGDKTETARQIAISCGLVSPFATDVAINDNNIDKTAAPIEKYADGGGLIMDLTLTANSTATTTANITTSEEDQNFQQLLHKLSTARRALLLQQQHPSASSGDVHHNQEGDSSSATSPLPVYLKIVRALIYVPLVLYKWSQSQLLRELWVSGKRKSSVSTTISSSSAPHSPSATSTATTTTIVQVRNSNSHTSDNHPSVMGVIRGAVASIQREIVEERMNVNTLFIEGVKYDVENTRINQLRKGGGAIVDAPSNGPPASTTTATSSRPRAPSISISGKDPWTGINNKEVLVAGGPDPRDPSLIFARTALEEYEEEGQFEELYSRRGIRRSNHNIQPNNIGTHPHHSPHRQTTTPLTAESLRNNDNLPPESETVERREATTTHGGSRVGYSVCVNGAMLDVLGLPEVSTGKTVIADTTVPIPSRLSNWFQRNFKQSRSDVYNKRSGNSNNSTQKTAASAAVLSPSAPYSPTASDTTADNDTTNSPARPLLDKATPTHADDEDEDAQHSRSQELARREFTELLLGATTVVCSRVTPSHKAKIVALVKNAGLMTLSIGDGGNDVAMIQEAHVGVGILGKEGRQAAKASDFTLAQFRYLATLLLVHGHYAYHRSAFIVQYSFYKGMILAIVQLLYNTQGTLFSGQTYWNSLSLTLYNGYFTVPLTLFFVMDVPLTAQVLRRFPQLYALPQSKRYMNSFTFFLSILRGLAHGVIIYFVCNAIFSADSIAPNGQTTGEKEVQWLPAYSVVILLQVLLVISESNTMNWIQWFWYLGPVGAICSYPILFTLYSILPKVAFHDVFIFVASYANFYLGVGVATGIVFMLSWGIWMPVKYYMCPSLLQLQRCYVRQLQHHEEEENKKHEDINHHHNNTKFTLKHLVIPSSSSGTNDAIINDQISHQTTAPPAAIIVVGNHDVDDDGSQCTMATANSNINATPTPHTTRSNSCERDLEVRGHSPSTTASIVPSSADPGGFWTSLRPRL